ncbi:hypothetical protein [Paracoccus sp. S3-43]|uniref:hypothetical protein n=1 Tax=Paracoccus sp. S3-43 TaxID=3030011 RepID=UPI0023AEC1B3|nr:hypothetical protein [Paracoccus sp. S3-43]WEF24492.1 hypothetical protein PXD02_00530 [Paracoccus sp. S3-43]
MRDRMTRTSAGVVIDLGGGDRIIGADTTLTIAQVADDIFGSKWSRHAMTGPEKCPPEKGGHTR